ncbi:helix-turn-helix transcriptional regulator [Solwaraspora sp. WMMD1047]|uniref:helix-turn-helix domain-containing protein n=1 Tax=Solwaraspora sp. WMMD1047 TaxID=3016102 RepID=UPI002417E79F|nr:helix-turn-helix transcriptional regulator [Solwaraspora sp. WMMD1047]MDG4831376.1 helix-turn-helix transcriptional regulator [Solwaraspora sp. WMMD1047]
MSEFRELLRRLRKERGLTRDQAGAGVGFAGSTVAAWEAGRLIPKPDGAKRLDDFYGTGDEIQRAAAHAREELTPWLRPWTDQEARAVALRWFEPLVIPGLLQTDEYARAIVGCSPRMASRVDEVVGRRLARQAAALERPEPVTLAAIIGEPALRIGDPKIMRPQLERLMEVSHLPHMHVRVVPMAAGFHPGLAGAFVLASLPDGRSVAYLDDQLRGRVAPDPPDVSELAQTWEAICELALPANQSRDLILKVGHEQH